MTQSISSPLWWPESLSHSSSLSTIKPTLSVSTVIKPTSGLARVAMQTPRQDMVSSIEGSEDCQFK